MSSDFWVATLPERLNVFADQLVEKSEYMSWLKEKGLFVMNCGGDGFSFPVRYQEGGLVRAIGDNTVSKAKTMATAQRLTVDYRAYGAELAFSRLQDRRNKFANKSGFDYKFAEEQLNILFQEFEDYLCGDLTDDGAVDTGDEATPLDGLKNIVDTDNTYLSINRSTSGNEWWQAQTEAVTNNALDDDDGDGVVNLLYYMRKLFLETCQGAMQKGKSISRHVGGAKSKPDLVYSGLTSFTNFCTALQPQQQYTGGKDDPGREVAFFGVPYRWDPYAQSDRIDVLNSKALMARVVGPELIYVDFDGPSGGSGTARLNVVGLVSQLQHFATRPSLLGFLSNTD